MRLRRWGSGLHLAALGALWLCGCMPARHDFDAGQERMPPATPAAAPQPAEVREWADRLLSDAPEARAAARAVLVQGGARTLPVLRMFLRSDNEDLHGQTFEVIRRLGPEALPLLKEMLRDRRAGVRQEAADILIDLAPDTESSQDCLVRALADRDSRVAGDAARALGALGEKAGPSVPGLVRALAHRDPHVRIYAAEALASIGPQAAPATEALAKALRDPVPGVRWAACEGLASIGPHAAAAVPQLANALQDDFLFVRICAAGALGSIGPAAEPATAALREAASIPALQAEALWALHRIAGASPDERAAASVPPAAPAATPLPAASGARPTGEPPAAPAACTGHPPADWDPVTGRNIVWSVALGDETFGRPVVSGEVVYVGTDNARRMNSACRDECGVLMAFRAADGAFLWQDVAPRVERGLRQFLLPSTTSAPLVSGDCLYYVTAECQLRCLDRQGFRDGENDGPYQEELLQDERAADIVWELDMCGRLGVFPHEACNSEVLSIGELLIVCTSNGRNEGHTRMPSPRAPSLIAVDRRSGEVVWRAVVPAEQVLHGQWCSPTAADVNGRIQVLFGGGDGWLRAYDAESGREIWRFDGNSKDARWLPRPGVSSRDSIIASPVYDGGRVFLAMGEDPTHGDGPSLLHAVGPNGQGDVTESRRLWTCGEIGRVVGTPIVSAGLLYVGDLSGTVTCVDAFSGAVAWKHETGGAIWGCLALAGDRLYAGNVDGCMTVLRAGRREELLARIDMDAALYSRPAAAGGALYVATARRLYRIAADP